MADLTDLIVAMPVWDMGVSALCMVICRDDTYYEKEEKAECACIATGVLSNRQVEN